MSKFVNICLDYGQSGIVWQCTDIQIVVATNKYSCTLVSHVYKVRNAITLFVYYALYLSTACIVQKKR